MKYFKWFKLLVAAVLALCLISLIFGCTRRDRRIYYYMDMDGNVGVGRECFRDNGALFCYEQYGTGLIQVKSFREVDR